MNNKGISDFVTFFGYYLGGMGLIILGAIILLMGVLGNFQTFVWLGILLIIIALYMKFKVNRRRNVNYHRFG